MSNLDMKNNIKLDVLISQACVVLRDVFRKRWQIIYNEDWENEKNFGNKLIQGFAKDVYKKAKNRQRLAMQNGKVDHFDIATLCPLLTALNAYDTTRTDKVMQQKIADITKVVNILAHPALEVMEVTEFKVLWQKIGEALMYLGFSETILNTFYWSDIADMHVVNERIISQDKSILANQLKKEADTAFEQNNIEQSIDFLSRALNLSGLSDGILVVLYVNRSSAYLKLSKTSENNAMAKDDAKFAVQCSPPWWKAYYMLGCSYDAAFKCRKAIESYEKALTLDPNQPEVVRAINGCRNWLSLLDNTEDVEPEPLMSQRRLRRNNCFKRLIISISSVNLKIMSTAMDQLRSLGSQTLAALSEALEDVYLAHCYIAEKNGVKKDFKKAVRHFARAAGVGNPEAIYNLAMLTLSGKGVRRKISTAIDLLDEAANMPIVNALNLPNFGVAEAQFALGLCYDDGIGLKQNIQMAANWYTRSSNNGCAEASNNLALLYAQGHGVFKNIERAVQYWKLAAFRGNVLAMESLEDYYLTIEDMKHAKYWWKTSMQSSAHDQSEKQELYLHVEDIEVDESDEDIEFICKNFGTDLLYGINTNLLPNGNNIFSGTIDMAYLTKRAKEGSKTADNLWKAFNHFSNAVDAFAYNNNTVTLTMIHEFAEGIRAEHTVGKWELDVLKDLPALIEEKLKLFSSQPPTSYESDLRIVYICLLSGENKIHELLKFIITSIERFPDESFLYDMHQSILGYLQLYFTGLESAKVSLKKFPNDLNILYNQAILTRLANKGTKEVIDACQMLLSASPIDYYRVPESYYVIASCHLLEKDIDLCRHFYNKGIEMEKEQLSCFLPYISITKKCIADVLEIMKENDDTHDQRYTEKTDVVESKENTATTSKVIPDSKERSTKPSGSASTFKQKTSEIASGSKQKTTKTFGFASDSKEKITKTSDIASTSKERNAETSDLDSGSKERNMKASGLASGSKQKTTNTSGLASDSKEKTAKTSDIASTSKERNAETSDLDSGSKERNMKASGLASGSKQKTTNTSGLASDSKEKTAKTSDIASTSKEKNAETSDLDSGSKGRNMKAPDLASVSKQKTTKTSVHASDSKEKTAKSSDIASTSKERNAEISDLDSGSKGTNMKAPDLASGSKQKTTKTSGLASDSKEKTAKTSDIASTSKERNAETSDLDSGSKGRNMKAPDLASGSKQKTTKTSGLASDSKEKTAKTSDIASTSKERNAETSDLDSGSKGRNMKAPDLPTGSKEKTTKTADLTSVSQEKPTKTSDSSVTTLKLHDKFQFYDFDANELRRFTFSHEYRIRLIVEQRKKIVATSQNGGNYGPKLRKFASLPKPNQDLVGLKTFNIVQMDTTKNFSYEGYVLKALSIDQAVVDNPISIIICDEKCAIIRCSIYNFNGSAETIQEKLGFGSTFNIVNPCVRIAADRTPGIRIDDPRFIIQLSTSESRCRFCYEVCCNLLRCAICKIGYCCKECQKNDWKYMNHGFICPIMNKMTTPTSKVAK